MSKDNNDKFYLDKVYPEPEQIFNANYKSIKELTSNCIYMFDTNVLLVPFSTTEGSFSVISKIFHKLKSEERILISARVAREFAKNRPITIGNIFLKLRQKKSLINSGHFSIDEFPLLEQNDNFKDLQALLTEIKKLLKKVSKTYEAIESDILNWNWDDPISTEYKTIFSPETIIEVLKDRNDIDADLIFRNTFNVAPGYKDRSKDDNGIGDLINWQTVLEVGKEKQVDIIFVSNDKKNDWYYVQDKTAIYPRFELFDEFRRFTNGKSIGIIDFPEFLKLFDVEETVLEEVEKSIHEEQVDKFIFSEILWISKEIEVTLRELTEKHGLKDEKRNNKILSAREMADLLFRNGVIEEEELNNIMNVQRARNDVAHGIRIKVEPDVIFVAYKLLDKLISYSNKYS